MLNHFCKKPLWECTQTLAAVAQGRQPADTVITGARLCERVHGRSAKTTSTWPSRRVASPMWGKAPPLHRREHPRH